MSSFTLTLDAGDFPRASDFFTALADAFKVFKAATGGPVSAMPALIVGERPGEPIVPAAEAASVSVDVEPKKERKSRAPKMADAASAPVGATPEPAPAATPPTPAPAEGVPSLRAAVALSDEALLAALRSFGNQVVDTKGPEPVRAMLAKFGARKWPELQRQQRLDALQELRAIVQAAG